MPLFSIVINQTMTDTQYADMRAIWVSIAKELKAMQEIINELRAEIERDTNLTSSIATVVDTLLSKVEELKNDPAELQELVDAARANNEALQAAIIKGTVAEPVSNNAPVTDAPVTE